MKKINITLLLLWSLCVVSGQPTVFFVSTVDESTQESMAICELDEELGRISIQQTFNGGKGPNYMALSKDRQNLYAVSTETWNNDNGQNSMNSFTVPEGVLSISELNSSSSFGIYPCHISLSPDNKVLLVANYVSGTIASLGRNADGSIGDTLSYWKYEGSKEPKAHYIQTSNDGRFVYAVFLGLDKVLNFQLSEDGKLSPNPAQESLSVENLAGPRHMALHENGKYAFILNELGNTLVSCSIDTVTGVLSILDTQSTLPEDFSMQSYAGAIRIHPNGKYLYCSNRGHNSIVSFKIEDDGTLTKAHTVTEGIDWVRDFNISPSGKYLVAGFEQDWLIALCSLDETGGIVADGNQVMFTRPACVVFYGQTESSTGMIKPGFDRDDLKLHIFNKGQEVLLSYPVEQGAPFKVEVFNTLGQIAYCESGIALSGRTLSIDVSGTPLESGVYFCRLSSGKQMETKSFLLP